MKKNKTQKLKLIRTKIDQIDTSLVKLLNKRAGLAKKTTVLKERIVYDPKREKQILQNIKK
jgi:chorismate mutase